jgi:DNA-directed RNA polymerase specialized sigma24 family protein
MSKRKSCLLPSGSCKCADSSGQIYIIPANAKIHLSEFSDEDLCWSAQAGCNVSMDFLWDKYQSYIQKIAFIENHHQHLPQCEMPDALQELYFAFHDSVQSFDPEGHCKGTPASFKTFLRLVVVRKFSNCCASWRRYHKHVLLEFDSNLLRPYITQVWDEYVPAPNYTQRKKYTLADWMDSLLNEFSSNNLIAVLRTLKLKERCFLALWLQCDLDKEAAELLGISTAAAKLRRERLFRRIRQKAI